MKLNDSVGTMRIGRSALAASSSFLHESSTNFVDGDRERVPKGENCTWIPGVAEITRTAGLVGSKVRGFVTFMDDYDCIV